MVEIDIWVCMKCENPSGSEYSDTFNVQISGTCNDWINLTAPIPTHKFMKGQGLYEYKYFNKVL